MADWKKQVEILPSLLDRLTDLEPRNRNEAPVLMAQGMRLLKQNIRRDIEWLLNSRRQIQSPPEWCRELNYSLYEYGLPDLTSMALNTSRDQAKLSSLIENAIAVFEPRLRNVVVSMVPVVGNNRVLRFQIEGLLRVEPGPERIQFDTTLDLTSGTYNVEGDAGAR